MAGLGELRMHRKRRPGGTGARAWVGSRNSMRRGLPASTAEEPAAAPPPLDESAVRVHYGQLD